MAQIISVVNQKGGVGKTTTAVNLGAYLAALGKFVLLLDLDPQANATSGLGVDKNSLAKGVYELLIGEVSAREVIVQTRIEGFRLIPSTPSLAGATIELVGLERREFRLADAMLEVRNDFDFILIDCPPSLGLLTVNGLTAADQVLIPVQAEYYALEGLSELLHTIVLIRDSLNPGLRLQGVLLTMYQHTNLSRQVLEDVRAHLGQNVFETIIPRNVTLSEAPSFGKPVIFYDLKSPGARAYMALALEVVSRG